MYSFQLFIIYLNSINSTFKFEFVVQFFATSPTSSILRYSLSNLAKILKLTSFHLTTCILILKRQNLILLTIFIALFIQLFNHITCYAWPGRTVRINFLVNM